MGNSSRFSRSFLGGWAGTSAAGAVIVLALLTGCTKPPPADPPIRSVRVMTVSMDVFQATHEYSAEVRPRVESRLGFRVAGKLVRRQAEVGQQVKKGQLLAQLDPQDYKLADSASRAQVAAAQTNRDLASADLARYRDLREKNFISGAELERRESALKAAQAQLEQAQAQQSAQGNQAGYANLTADISGVVTAVEAEPGQVVAAGAPVVRIAQDGARDVVFSVPEDRITALKIGALVDVRLWASQTRLEGAVREIAATADAQTRTFLVKVALAGDTQPPLGSTVYAVPQGIAPTGLPVVKLPTSALKQEGRATAVWLLDKATMTVKPQVIEIATADGNEAVVSSGLKPGDVVVSAGVHVLSPGQKVTIYLEKATNVPPVPEGRASSAIKTVAN